MARRRPTPGVRPPVLALAFALLAAGCRQDPPPLLDPEAHPVDGVAVAGREDGAVPELRVDRLPRCAPRQVTTVRWNAALVADGPVDIVMDNARRTVFATAAGAGAQATGEWAREGMVFLAIDAEGREVARAVVEGPDGCD